MPSTHKQKTKTQQLRTFMLQFYTTLNMSPSVTIAIMQPYFFPYIGYFQLINSVAHFVVYDHVKFTKPSWVYRNQYYDINAGVCYFHAPLQTKGSQLIQHIHLDNRTNWQRTLLRKLHHNYRQADHFDEVFPLIAETILQKEDYLSIYNLNSIRKICQFLTISTQIHHNVPLASDIEESLVCPNFTNLSASKTMSYDEYKRNHRINKLCDAMGATSYINPIGGTKLYSKEFFSAQNKSLYFIQTGAIQSRQYNQKFSPNLSIIDVLFHLGKNGTQQLLNTYTLI